MARGKLNQGGDTARRIRVGLVITLAAVVLAYGIFQVGRLFDVFASRYPLVTLLDNSAGLIEGAPVTLSGRRVGQVADIRFLPVEARTDSTNIVVVLDVNRDVESQIRADSRASLQTQGLLGNRFVDITPGSPDAEPLQSGDTIPGVPALDYESVLRTAATTMSQVQNVVDDLQVLTGRLADGEGTLGALLADERLYERMTTATDELGALLATVNRSDGALSRMIRDPELYDRMSAAMARLDSLGQVILAGQGSLGRLVRDDSLYDGLVDVTGRADSTLAGLDSLLARAGEGDGTLTRLLDDPELYDQLLKTVVDLQNLIRALREDPAALSPEIEVF